jgi:hypothetical protein
MAPKEHGPSDTTNTRRRGFRERHFVWLFFSVLLFVLLASVSAETYLLTGTLYTVVLFAAVYSTIERRRYWVPLSLFVPALGMTWVSRLTQDMDVLDTIAEVLHLVFFVYVIAVVLRFVFRSKRVTSNVLFAGLSLYLLVGMAWVTAYQLVEAFSPGSFAGGVLEGASRGMIVRDLLYFSFVSLTTLGYGDITPISPLARSVAILEAITGVLSLAIIIARLVSAWTHEHEE